MYSFGKTNTDTHTLFEYLNKPNGFRSFFILGSGISEGSDGGLWVCTSKKNKKIKKV